MRVFPVAGRIEHAPGDRGRGGGRARGGRLQESPALMSTRSYARCHLSYTGMPHTCMSAYMRVCVGMHYAA
jgi:hypothetical protein